LHTFGFGGAAVALLGVFLAYGSRIANPVFPPPILCVPGLVGTQHRARVPSHGDVLDVPARRAVVPHVHGYGALETGLAFLPMTLMMGAGLPPGVAARLMSGSDRW
jgi:hypothetical protein